MTITEAKRYTLSQISRLSKNPSLDSRLVLCHVLDLTPVQLETCSPQQIISQQEVQLLQESIERILNHEPVELIIGWTEFLGHKIDLIPGVLIPRVETEALAKATSEAVKQKILGGQNVTILEVGTGSGCITTTLLIRARELNPSSQVQIVGIDSSAAAIRCTETNLRKNSANSITAKTKNILTSIQHMQLPEYINEPFPVMDILVSNPPYVTEREIEQLSTSVQNFEPLEALKAGRDGLSVYREIASFICKHQEVYSTLPQLFLEISNATALGCSELFGQIYGAEHCLVSRDLFGRKRYLTCAPDTSSSRAAVI